MKNILLAILFLALAFTVPFFFYEVLIFLVAKLGAGWVFGTIYIRLLVIILTAISFYLIFQAIPKTRKLKFMWVFLIALGPGFGISFIAPIYQGDYGMFSSDFRPSYFSDLDDKTGSKITSNNSKKLVAFFTTTCPHCKVASNNLGYNLEAGQALEVNAFFPGTKEDADKFISTNNGKEFNYYTINDDDFFLGLSGNYFPSIFLLDENNAPLYHWAGEGVNFTCLDYLLDLEP